MKNLKQTTVVGAIAAVLALGAGPLLAGGTSSSQFLKLGSGARAAAMGDAFVAVADDVTAGYWNPAGLATLEAPEVSMMHNAWLSDSQYQTLSAALPLGRLSLGGSLYRMSYGSIERYTEANVKDGSFDASSLAAAASASFKLGDDLSIGGSLKLVQETIEAESGATFALDAGVLYRRNGTSFGASLSNVGPGMTMVETQEDLPTTLRLGASRRFLEDRLTVALGASKPNDNDFSLNLGTEYRVAPLFTVRGGYAATPGNQLDVDGLTGITGGFGLSLGRFGIDYAVAPFGDLGLSHRVSLTVRFADPK